MEATGDGIENGIENGNVNGEEAPAKKKKKKKKNKNAKPAQTDPPTIAIGDLFPNGDFPMV